MSWLSLSCSDEQRGIVRYALSIEKQGHQHRSHGVYMSRSIGSGKVDLHLE